MIALYLFATLYFVFIVIAILVFEVTMIYIPRILTVVMALSAMGSQYCLVTGAPGPLPPLPPLFPGGLPVAPGT